MAPRILLWVGLLLLAAHTSLSFIVQPSLSRRAVRVLATGPQTTLEGKSLAAPNSHCLYDSKRQVAVQAA